MRLLHLHWPHLLLRLARSRSSVPFEERSRSSWAGGRGRRAGSWTRADRRWSWASGSGCRSGRRTGWPRRRCFLDPDPAADGGLAGGGARSTGRLQPRRRGRDGSRRRRASGGSEVQLDGLERLWGPEPLIVPANRRGAGGDAAGAAAGGDRRDSVRGGRGGRSRGEWRGPWRAARSAPRRRAGRGRGIPGAAARRAAEPRSGGPRPARSVRVARHRPGRRAAALRGAWPGSGPRES